MQKTLAAPPSGGALRGKTPLEGGEDTKRNFKHAKDVPFGKGCITV
jgi:hypothetical protein